MSKYKVKPLVAQERLQTYFWEGTGLSYHYTWDIEETDVTTWERGYSDVIGQATTLEAAQTIVDEHHQKEIEALLDAVLESPEAQLAALSAWVNRNAADVFDSKCQELVDEHMPAFKGRFPLYYGAIFTGEDPIGKAENLLIEILSTFGKFDNYTREQTAWGLMIAADTAKGLLIAACSIEYNDSQSGWQLYYGVFEPQPSQQVAGE